MAFQPGEQSSSWDGLREVSETSPEMSYEDSIGALISDISEQEREDPTRDLIVQASSLHLSENISEVLSAKNIVYIFTEWQWKRWFSHLSDIEFIREVMNTYRGSRESELISILNNENLRNTQVRRRLGWDNIVSGEQILAKIEQLLSGRQVPRPSVRIPEVSEKPQSLDALLQDIETTLAWGWVFDFQSQYGDLDNDGKLWPNTANRIISLYERGGELHLPESIPQEVRHRVEIHYDMQRYPSWDRWVKKAGKKVELRSTYKPNAFDKNLYFWNTPGKPIEWGPFNSDLYNKVPHTDNSTETTTYIRKVGWVPAMITYIWGELVFCSYTAPGKDIEKKRSPDNVTLTWKSSMKYWISGADFVVEEVSKATEEDELDIWKSRWPMPYSVAAKVEEGIHVHGGDIGWEAASAGCFRLPLHYAKHFFDIFNQSGKHMKYVIGDLYA